MCACWCLLLLLLLACRRFQPVYVLEPSEQDTLAILHGLSERYERHHHCVYSEEALEAAVKLSHTYIADRFLPDKVGAGGWGCIKDSLGCTHAHTCRGGPGAHILQNLLTSSTLMCEPVVQLRLACCLACAAPLCCPPPLQLCVVLHGPGCACAGHRPH